MAQANQFKLQSVLHAQNFDPVVDGMRAHVAEFTASKRAYDARGAEKNSDKMVEHKKLMGMPMVLRRPVMKPEPRQQQRKQSLRFKLKGISRGKLTADTTACKGVSTRLEDALVPSKCTTTPA